MRVPVLMVGMVLLVGTGCQEEDLWQRTLRGDWETEVFDLRRYEVPYHSGDPEILIDERDYAGEVQFTFSGETTDQAASYFHDWRTGAITLPDGHVVDFDWDIEDEVGGDTHLWIFYYEDAIFEQGGWTSTEASVTSARSEFSFRLNHGDYAVESLLVLTPQ